MTETDSKKEKELKILGDLFGYLAIILGLLIPFLLEEIKKEDITPKDEIEYILSIEVIFLLLIGICSFYFFRYLGKDYIAENLGIILIAGLFFVVIIILLPLPSPIIFINSALRTNDLRLLVTAVTTMGLGLTLIIIGSAYYFYVINRLRSRKKTQEKDSKL